MHLIGNQLNDLLTEAFTIPHPDPLPASEMSLLRALGPVQTWLGQELEKCGIDAVIYTRYVLSLLLHDSYDYDLQDQENDIFLGWEKGTGKKWGKGKKKSTDLSLEEMKKQAAVQCLRSASDESSGIETLVEELCSKLKDLENKQKEKLSIKKSDGSQSPELVASPSSKDQVEMYYEAFPPLSEKTVCLQEIMTVWNKAKACSYSSSSSSSAAPQTSTDTSSPKDCNSEGEAVKEKNTETCSTLSERTQIRKSKKEKENRYSNTIMDVRATHNKKQIRHRPEAKLRPRSWSSGSSEAGSSSSGNQYELKTSIKSIKARHKTRDAGRNKKGKNNQLKLSLKGVEKDERKSACGSSSSSGFAKQQLCKRGKRPLKEIRKDTSYSEIKEFGPESRNKKEYKEEPLWYTEPITEYFVPFSSKSKLETTYRNRLDSHDGLSVAREVENLSESVQGICIANSSFQRTYLAAGTFIDGHFVEMPAIIDEVTDLNGTSHCPQQEDSRDLDDKHLSEFTHFYEVDIYQSILDPSASNSLQESRILNMIRQKNKEHRDFEAECCVVLDGLELQGESAIRTDSHCSVGADGYFLQDIESIAQVWECYSSSTSDEIDGESFAGDSPIRLSPILNDTVFNATRFSENQEETFSEANDVSGLNSSCFSLFEVQYDNSANPFPCDSLAIGQQNTDSNCIDSLGNKQSRLLIWTKNSAFDETEHCSNLSTRTCSPWSHSEETRSDNETVNIHLEESAQFSMDDIKCIVPSITSKYLEDDLLDFLQKDTCEEKESTLREMPDLPFKKTSKLESVCGIKLEKDESKSFETSALFVDNINQQNDNYSSGIIKDIWTNIREGDTAATLEEGGTEDCIFTPETNTYCCCLDIETKTGTLQVPQKKAVQRSEYHLWDGKKEHLEETAVVKNEISNVDGGDYTTPSKAWDVNPDKDSNAFIPGGVYGELKSFNSDGDWAVIQPTHSRGSLLQCAASEVVTIAGTDVFMNPGNCFAPGHKPLWRPLVSFGQCDHTVKRGDGLNKGFSFIFHEDLLGSYNSFQNDDPGLDYSFSSFDLNNPFSQVLHVECSFEPEDIATFSPGFKPKSILCSDSESEAFHPRIYGINRTQYRAIRISPRTHFRPISASELSPGGGSESELESEKEEASLPIVLQTDVFEDPQADLKPLEEDAEREGPFYGKSELESGKFLPRLKKSGMEKSAQTSLDSAEGSSILLPITEQGAYLSCDDKALAVKTEGESSIIDYGTEEHCKKSEETCKCLTVGHDPKYKKPFESAEDLEELSSVSFCVQGENDKQQNECWWQKRLCSPVFPGSQCAECCSKTKEMHGVKSFSEKENPVVMSMTAATCDSNCSGEKNSGARATGFRRQLFSSESSSSDETASENGSDWVDPCEEDLISRTQL
ncbi:uncharacterized protein KIAA0232 homolog isoform X2 [Erpetoichthys calabaricus]|uniref:uncharacterized protein KIAA0232 homolog isoform X2 n=1 Tax=Erpetoichthys calabaricus TaxID=27687 RepID=UPI00109F2499|nr:uncharacterized protein KIAA0232 homolog isoform X2 [Erpetoichthys calabaricus]